MSQSRAQTRSARSGFEGNNHEATAPPYLFEGGAFIQWWHLLIFFCPSMLFVLIGVVLSLIYVVNAHVQSNKLKTVNKLPHLFRSATFPLG